MSTDTDAAPMEISPWCWYYLADCGGWHRFEDEPCHCLKSDFIERRYSEDLKGVLDLDESWSPSRIDFSAMVQTDLRTNRQRRICRVDFNIEMSCSCFSSDPVRRKRVAPTCAYQNKWILDRNNIHIQNAIQNQDLCGISCREKEQKERRIQGVTEERDVQSDTSWFWYYLADCGRRHRFEDDPCSSLKSEDIEKHYLKDPKGFLSLNSWSCHTRIDFSAMLQTDLKTKRQRPIFRDIKVARSCSCFSSAPVFWEMVDPTRPYQLIPLSKLTPEYQTVTGYVKKDGLLDNNIVSVIRIQNLDLWEIFCRKKQQLKRIQGVREIQERRLFHGTNVKNVDTICKYNFDVRLAGRHAAAYGKGVYFAKYASIADRYSRTSSSSLPLHRGDTQSTRFGETKVLFLARVVIGKPTLGAPDLQKPDHQSSENFHDSCVDKIENPNIFIIFDSNQIYPEYLIQYKSKPESV
ncbi:protein mono-ADP-ribosyltransferase PARP11-like [Betta splendens]|uniref:Poly [ADP-ribose] polymerase n=1 Tax=Betta splendens TaxID=158456 RepID=A0A6P7NK56_BETSP|nr:protein mono-ADP-ribosyltransferase PARP11-like [Betta splendens]